MSSMRQHIDYGPLSLPVGEVLETRTAIPADERFRSDVARLQSILSNSTLMASDTGQPDRGWLAGQNDAAHSGPEYDVAELGQEIEQLWVNNGAGGLREVRIKLAPGILPGAWVRILVSAGELRVEISAALAGTRQWLDSAADRLAHDLSQRLSQSVRIVVMNGAGVESASVAIEWKGERY
jgi:hypothetical protein